MGKIDPELFIKNGPLCDLDQKMAQQNYICCYIEMILFGNKGSGYCETR